MAAQRLRILYAAVVAPTHKAIELTTRRPPRPTFPPGWGPCPRCGQRTAGDERCLDCQWELGLVREEWED
ncbi:MAG: hypothetical protein ACREN1_07710 [Candidatus Dormibacteria bacterium]